MSTTEIGNTGLLLSDVFTSLVDVGARARTGGDRLLMLQTLLDVDANTIAYFPVGRNQNLLDVSGNEIDATAQGAAVIGDDGLVLGAITDGANTADDAALDIAAGPYKIGFWCKGSDITNNDRMAIFGRGGLTIWMFRTGTVAQDRLELAQSGWTKYTDSNVIENDAWYYVEYLSVSGAVRIYVNNVDVWGYGTHVNLPGGSTGLTLGNVSGMNDGFPGVLDDFRFCKTNEHITPYRFPASGTATGVVDGGSSQGWTDVAVTSTTTGDNEGAVSVRYRAGDTNPPTGDWSVSGTVTGRYIELELTLTPKADTMRTETPAVTLVTLTHEASGGGGETIEQDVAEDVDVSDASTVSLTVVVSESAGASDVSAVAFSVVVSETVGAAELADTVLTVMVSESVGATDAATVRLVVVADEAVSVGDAVRTILAVQVLDEAGVSDASAGTLSVEVIEFVAVDDLLAGGGTGGRLADHAAREAERAHARIRSCPP